MNAANVEKPEHKQERICIPLHFLTADWTLIRR